MPNLIEDFKANPTGSLITIKCKPWHNNKTVLIGDASAFSESRKPNADAISDLAMRNFVEMRDLVADDNFLLRKAIEKQITTHYPDKYLPLYSMVTFSQKPYAEALREGLKQDALFKDVLTTENIGEMASV